MTATFPDGLPGPAALSDLNHCAAFGAEWSR